MAVHIGAHLQISQVRVQSELTLKAGYKQSGRSCTEQLACSSKPCLVLPCGHAMTPAAAVHMKGMLCYRSEGCCFACVLPMSHTPCKHSHTALERNSFKFVQLQGIENIPHLHCR